MQTDNFIISLDVGTQNIKASALSTSDQTVIYGALEESKGISREGEILPKELCEAIKNVINKLELKIKRKIKSSFISIPSEFVHLISSEGHSLVLDEEVSQRELDEAKESIKRVFHGPDEVVVDQMISKYSVDDTLYRNPCGVKGKKLSLYGQVALAKKDFIEALKMAMDMALVEISGMGLASEGAASLLLTKTDLREGVVLVDAGASSTRLTLFYNQKIEDFEWIKLGGQNITKDISIVMKKTWAEAEEMKKAYGKGQKDNSEEDFTLLEQVAKARIEEIMVFVKEFMKKHEKYNLKKIIYYGGGLCGFLNIFDLYETTLKQSTNFMTSDIIRDDTVLHIQSGGLAYRILSDINCIDQKDNFNNLEEEELDFSVEMDTVENRINQDQDEESQEIDHKNDAEEYDEYDIYDESYEDEKPENKFIAWIKNIIKRIKNA